MKHEILFYWIATGTYAIVFILSLISIVFKKEKIEKRVPALIYVGLASQIVSIAIRWIRVGHGPYINLYEVMNSNSLVAVALFVVFRKKYSVLDRLKVVIFPIVMLSMGFGLMSSSRDIMLPPSLRSFWLVLHVIFAKLAYGSLIIALAQAVMLIHSNNKKKGSGEDKFNQERLDLGVYRFNLLGFAFCTVMIVSGSIWAKNAWGRYWAFDPVETWALITWLCFGLYLHLRLNRNWTGQRSAWLTVFLFITMVLSFFIIPYAQDTLHTEYLVR